MNGRRVRATMAAAAVLSMMTMAAADGGSALGQRPPTPPTPDIRPTEDFRPIADFRPTADGSVVGPTAAADGSVGPTARPVDEPAADGLKKVMWKRCMSKNYATCVKLALVHLVDRLERANESYSLAPGVTLSSTRPPQRDGAEGDRDGAAAPATAGRDSSEAFDGLFVDRLGRYFGSLSLDVKLLDDETARSVRKLGEAAAGAASVHSGRGKKQKHAQSILMAGWVTGAMLLALGMKAIAVLAGKALMTALMSLLLSALASFRGGHAGHLHAEPKSTTYEIVTKPVYSHSSAIADDAHAAAAQNNPAYRRSIAGGAGGLLQQALAPLVAAAAASSEEADHVVYRIHASDKTPIYIPIERRRRRRR